MEPEQPEEVGQVAGDTHKEEFEFVYEGPDVANGTMDANEVVEVLSGLTRTFSTIANEGEPNERIQLRIKDVEPGSFRIIFEAITFAAANPVATTTAIAVGTAVVINAINKPLSRAYRVVTDIAKVIEAKKKLKGVKIATQQAGFSNGDVAIQVPDDEDLLILTKEQYELLLSRRVDKHLSQIVSPLENQRIDTFHMRRATTNLVTVAAEQRTYFDVFEAVEDNSREGTQIVGILNSLSKSNLRGTFHTSEGVHVPYKYVGGDVGQLLRGFASRELVRVRGKIRYGRDGLPTHIDAENIDVLQQKFFDDEPHREPTMPTHGEKK